MNNIIQPGYVSGASTAPHGAKQDNAQAGAFLDMLAAGALPGMDPLAGGVGGGMTLPTASLAALSTAARAATQARMGGAAAGQIRAGGTDPAGNTGAAKAAGAVSLEDALKAKYPGLHYHIFDASSSHWRSRNDYPHYLLYQDGSEAKETLENWRPSGPNPFYGSIDGKFIAPPELRALGSVPPGSKAVVIHPKVQARMEQDPEYAQVIMAKIDAWFAFDVARNEAILPGCTVGMSQAVAIGEDGDICNACASSTGRVTTSSSGDDDNLPSWWDLRMARHDKFMRRLIEQQIEHKQQVSDFTAAAAAKARLAEMLHSGDLRAALGDTVAGMPTEDLLALTRKQVWGTA